MPYFISNEKSDCKNGWATVDNDGKTITCHENKEQAIKHMVAISIGAGEEPGGTYKPKSER